MKYHHSKIESPVGSLHLISNSKELIALIFQKNWNSYLKQNQIQLMTEKDKIILKTESQLQQYFSGKRRKFTIPLKMSGTQFQNTVWNSLLTIAYGQTLSYGVFAERIHNPKAVRACGTAIGKNQIGILVPCHRVVGKNGDMIGFNAGLEIKKQLLSIEKQQIR
jgi:methylated-DNA-[protein]-cysteine S-methyltransferase